MLALKRIPWRNRRAKAQEWARRSHAPDSKRVQRRLANGPDFTTILARALHDRRGQLVRRGHLYRGDGRVQAWRIVHSVTGRTDQYDIMLDGRLHLTGGPAIIAAEMPGIKLAPSL